MTKYAALQFGFDSHLLDHICPLAELLKMPLYVTEERNEELVKSYYPNVGVFYKPYDDLSWTVNYDILFKSSFWMANPIDLLLNSSKKNSKKKMHFGFCPHGNSDKGYKKPILAPITKQDIVLIYGEHMVQRLKTQKLWDQIRNPIFIGNYRLAFYRKYQNFYDNLVEKEIFSRLNPKNSNLLYAPTWDDSEESTSFFKFGKDLFKSLTSNYNLIVKLHPLLEEKEPALFYHIISQAESFPNIRILTDFPLIYPLLSRCDIYLGDFSSIGYDFLVFDRPLFFLDPHEKILQKDYSRYLHQCGMCIPTNDISQAYSYIEKKLIKCTQKYKEKRMRTLKYAFGEEKSFEEIQKNLQQKIKTIHKEGEV